MKVTSSSKKKTYQMMLSGQKNNTDRIDYFTFTLDKKSKIVVSAKADVASNVRIIIKKKTADGYQIINEKENEQYMISNNGKSTFTYKSENLSKGTYYIMVWAPAEETQQICYTINATKGA